MENIDFIRSSLDIGSGTWRYINPVSETVYYKTFTPFELNELTLPEDLIDIIGYIRSATLFIRSRYEDLEDDKPDKKYSYSDSLVEPNLDQFDYRQRLLNWKVILLSRLYNFLGEKDTYRFKKPIYQPDWAISRENDVVGLTRDEKTWSIRLILKYKSTEFESNPLEVRHKPYISELIEIVDEILNTENQ